MATIKTECSEISVAFGLLGYNNPSTIHYAEVSSKFEGTLSEVKFDAIVRTFPTDPMFASLNNVGFRLRGIFPLFNNLGNVKWTGGDRLAATMSTAKDLEAVNIPISVKAESRVVGNPSPYNLFVATPQGSAQARGMSSWYLETARDEYQEFYSFTRTALGLTELPENVAGFEVARNKRLLIDSLGNLHDSHVDEFQRLYLRLCRKVSLVSAEAFNRQLLNSLNSRTKGAVLERVAKMFFRMNAVSYLLCGIDGRSEFAVNIPDLTSWLQNWQFEGIEAIPRPDKEQSIVDFNILCMNKKSGDVYLARFHAEIRWSHGKFSSVEGKLYKEFGWTDLPFFQTLISQ